MLLTNKHGLPESFVDVVKSLVYDPSEKDPKRVSVTTLIQNPTIKLLTVRHWPELEEDVTDHIWRILGNAVHYILEKADSNTRLSEEKLELEVDGLTVVGKLDLYDGKTCEVIDWKVTSVFAVKDGCKPEWEKQLNIYAYLLRKCGIEVKKLTINAIPKDHSKMEYMRFGGNYPPVPFKSIAVNLWTVEEQERYLRHRVALYKSVMDLTDDKLPICNPEERWAKKDVYAIYKNANKTATRLLETAEEAQKMIDDLAIVPEEPEGKKAKKAKPKDTYRIEKRPGEDMRCLNFCGVNKFCSYYKQTYGDRDGQKTSVNPENTEA